MKTLADLGELRTGFQLRGAAKHDERGANPIIQLGDVRDEGIDVRRLIRMDFARAREKDFVRAGDILLRSRGASYGAALVPDCSPGTVAAAPLYVLRVEEAGILPEFVAWFVNRPGTQSILAAQARGTYVPTISIKELAALEVIVPPLAEQRRIATIDALLREERALTLRLLDKQEQLAQAVLNGLLEGRVREP